MYNVNRTTKTNVKREMDINTFTRKMNIDERP